jgi:hypothetical protein
MEASGYAPGTGPRAHDGEPCRAARSWRPHSLGLTCLYVTRARDDEARTPSKPRSRMRFSVQPAARLHVKPPSQRPRQPRVHGRPRVRPRCLRRRSPGTHHPRGGTTGRLILDRPVGPWTGVISLRVVGPPVPGGVDRRGARYRRRKEQPGRASRVRGKHVLRVVDAEIDRLVPLSRTRPSAAAASVAPALGRWLSARTTAQPAFSRPRSVRTTRTGALVALPTGSAGLSSPPRRPFQRP